MMKIIAHIENDYTSKFGVPRQSGLVDDLISTIVFEPEYRVAEALRGLEDFSHIWLIWGFDQTDGTEWSPTVRPPRLGGNRRVGVFATRSPFRPNRIGLSSVRLQAICPEAGKGTVLKVSGADLMNGTPIYDIKPYLPYADAHPDASGGFADRAERRKLQVIIPDRCRIQLPEEKIRVLEQILAQDPRPAYQHDPDRVYAFEYAGRRIRFRVTEETVTVLDAMEINKT